MTKIYHTRYDDERQSKAGDYIFYAGGVDYPPNVMKVSGVGATRNLTDIMKLKGESVKFSRLLSGHQHEAEIRKALQ